MSNLYESIRTAVYSIRNAITGLDVRDSIADAIEDMNEKTEEVNNGYQALLNAWLDIRDSDNLSFSEVIEARTDSNNVQHNSLKARIDSISNDTTIDKTITATHTFNKNSKTVAINGEGITAGTNKFDSTGAVLNKLTVTELINLGSGSNGDSGWIQLANNINSNITNATSWPSRMRKIDSLVYFDFRITGITQADTVVATLPEGYRPSRIMYFWGNMGTTGGYPCRFSIDTTGVVTVLGTSAFVTSYSSTSLLVLTGSFLID